MSTTFRNLYSPRLKFVYLGIAIVITAGLAVLEWKLNQPTKTYRPVVLIHGLFANAEGIAPIEARIKEKHPGTITYNTDKYPGTSSLMSPLWTQVEDLGREIMALGAAHPEGIHIVAHSQGGLLARAIVEKFSDHNVRSLITLGTPHAGQYGANFLLGTFQHLSFKKAYEFFYLGSDRIYSVADYWNDPHQQELYLQHCKFLPYVNNEVITNYSATFKKGLTRLNKLVLIGGPHDVVVTPWQSSQFGFFNENETVILMRNRVIYKEDRIGLKTLDEQNKLILHTVLNASHSDWQRDVSITDRFIIPHLD